MINEEQYKEQLSQVIEYLRTEKTRKNALDIILSLSESEALISTFIYLDMPKILIRMIENEEIDERPLALQILINLTGQEKYLDSFILINSFKRITRLIYKAINQAPLTTQKTTTTFENVEDIYIGNHTIDNNNNSNSRVQNVNQSSCDIKLVIDKYIINPDTISNQIKNKENEAFINLYFILLGNMTSFEAGQRAFLEVTNEQVKGNELFKLLDKFFEYIYNPCFDFCSSLIANMSSLKEGRDVILSNKIFKIFLIQFDKMNNMKMINILRLIRNCCFEYEAYFEELMVKDGIVFGYLIRLIILTNIEKSQMQNIGIEGIDKIYYPYFNSETLAEDDKETINDLIIDIMLILTNNPKAIEFMKERDVGKAIVAVEEKLIKNEVLKDRMTIIKNYMEGKH